MKRYWELGYTYGSSLNLSKKVQVPNGLTLEQIKAWFAGVDAVISDRLS